MPKKKSDSQPADVQAKRKKAKAKKAGKTAAEPTPRKKRVATPKAGSKRGKAQPFDPAQYREEIARLAYTLWQERGCPDGSPDDDWNRAEQQLRRKAAGASA